MTEFSNKSSMSTVFNSLGTSFYPVGMGLSVNLRNQGGYKSWKGTGVNSNPVGIAQGHIRPLTNNDPGNVFQTGFGLARPIKHFRKGRVIPSQPITGVPNLNGINENALINYNMNRFVKSSKGASLGGGAGGSGLIDEMQDKPGAFIVKENPLNEVDGVIALPLEFRTEVHPGERLRLNEPGLTVSPPKMGGHMEFADTAHKLKIKPILGCEFYIAKNRFGGFLFL